MNRIPFIWGVFLLLGASSRLLLSQTNPAAQPIPFNQDFGPTTFTSMPAGMVVWNGISGSTISTQEAAEGSSPSGDAAVTAATAPQTTGGAYGFATSGNGRPYIQTSSNATNGVNQIALAINTTGKTSIVVEYDVEIISAQTRTVGIVMQYRVGTSGPWTTVSGTGNPYSQAGGTAGVKASPSLLLPNDAGNQPVVQLRWAIWRGAETGSSSGIGIDDLSVTGTVSGGTPTKLSVLSINGGNPPSASEPFDVTVQSLDNSDFPASVTVNTNVTLSKASGTGTFGGTLSGTITAGSNSVTIEGVTYSIAESGVAVTATRTSGNMLSPGTSPAFTVLAPATHLAFVGMAAGGQPDMTLPVFSVEARRSDNSVDVNFPSSITLTKQTGPGNVTGTLEKPVTNGVAFFNDIAMDMSGGYALSAGAPGVAGATSSTIILLSQSLPLGETFPYADGTTLTHNGWNAHSGGGQMPLTVASGNLTYAGYPSSGQGRSVQVSGGSGSREDVSRSFAEQSAGSVYASFLVNVTSAPTGGEYFFHLGPASVGSTFRGRVFIKDDGAGNLLFGISKASSTVNYSLTPYSYATTYLIVMRYQFVGDAAGTDDIISLWVNPSLSGTEPTPDLTNTDVGNDSPVGSVAIRQGSGSCSLLLDAIQIGTTWNDAPLPVQLSSFTGTLMNNNHVRLAWTTTSELHNYGFVVQRRLSGDSAFTDIRNSFIAGAGTTLEPRQYVFIDNPLQAGRMQYRLCQIDLDGTLHYTDPIRVDVLAAAAGGSVPAVFSLDQNFPNPFNPETVIRFSVATRGNASLRVYNLIGQEVATLFAGIAEPGMSYNVRLNGTTLPSGVYFYKLESGGKGDFKKLMLLK